MPLQPKPFWESPTSFHLPPPLATAIAISENAIPAAAAPLPIPMPLPPLQTPAEGPTTSAHALLHNLLATEDESPSTAAPATSRSVGSNASSIIAEDVSAHPRSLPIVLSACNSSDDEGSEGTNAGLEDQAGVAERQNGGYEVDAREEEVMLSASVGCNGGSLGLRRLSARNSFTRTRSGSFNSSLSVGGACSMLVSHRVEALSTHSDDSGGPVDALLLTRLAGAALHECPHGNKSSTTFTTVEGL